MSSDTTPLSTSNLHVTLADVGPKFEVPAGADRQPIEDSLPDTHPLNLAREHFGAANIVGASKYELINVVACSANRMRAAESIVHHLAAEFPKSAIRCAMGTRQLQRIYDRRLGWLGQQSSLRIEAEDRWESILEDAQTELDETGVVFSLAQPNGDGKCVIWVDGEDVNAQSVQEFDQVRPVLQNILWRRPRISTPQVLERLGYRAKFWVAIAFAIVVIIAVFPIRYPVACSARVEPVHQRLISAPFEATLMESMARPGEHVKKDQVLAVLDGRPLRLELESAESELHRASKEHNVALATGKIAEAQQLMLQRQRFARRIDLLNDRLSRLTLTSPIGGVVVSGDVEKFVGASIEIGQTIFEVAPLNTMVVEIEIPEHEIGFVKPDAMSRVRIGAVGGKSIRMPLSDLYPAAELRNDQNVFVGRIIVDNEQLQLRPGMQGDATIYGPLRPLAWSWVRGSWERVLWWLGY